MIKKIDANKYGVVRYAISSIEDIADLPREVSVGSEAILVNEDGEKKFRLGSDGWIEVVEVKEYDEDKLRDILEDAKVGYGGIEYGTLEERLDKDFDNVYSVLDNRTYVEYEGCGITAKDSLNGLQKETVIKGRTLQNLVPMGLFESYKAENWNVLTKECYSFNNGYLTLNCREDGYVNAYPDIGNMFKTNTVYTMVLDLKENTLVRDSGATFVFLTGRDTELFIETINASQIKKGLNVFKLTTHSDLTNAIYIARTFIYNNVTSGHITFRYAIYEGDHTQTPLEELPFIEGIESVGDKSKNLFDGNYHKMYIHTDYLQESSTNYSAYIKCKPNTSYSISKTNKSTISLIVCGVNEYPYNKQTIENRKVYSGSYIAENYVTGANSNYLLVRFCGSTEDDILEEVINSLQIEEGSQATPYQEYYDGYKISGKSCGKNLFDKNKIYDVYKFDASDSDESQVTRVGGTGHKFIRVELSNGNYTIQINTKNYYPNNWTFRIFETDKEEVEVGDILTCIARTTVKIPNTTIVKFTTTKKYQYIKISYNPDKFAEQDVLDTIQIEENDHSTTYEPYKETTYSYILDEPLRSLPNGVCDEIDLEKGVVTRRVGKVVLDETIKISTVSIPTDQNFFRANMPIETNKINGLLICDAVPNFNIHSLLGGSSTINFECICSHNGNNEFNLILKAEKVGECTAKSFLNYFKNNPITVYYELTEPTTEYLIKDDKFVTLPNGVKDEISHNSVLRKVGKVVFDGSKDEKWEVWTVGGENVYKFVVPIPNLKSVDGNPLLCNIFKYLSSANISEEGIYNGSIGRMGLKISKTKLTSGSIDEFRKWLTLNPITVYYELETPYTESINPNEVILDTTYLKSYEPITHITSDNYLLPTIETQVPSDFNAVVLGLKSNNEALASQVMSLRQTNDELETTNREQDDVIDVTLLALDEVYGMIDESEIETMSMGSPMVNVYVKMIKRGIKTLDEVPAKYRAEVEELI